MNVLAESNFVLEIALRQSEAKDALRIVELAESREIRLVVPAYAFAEPFHKLEKAKRERRQLQDRLEAELGQMARSADFSDIKDKSTATMAALADKSDLDKQEFDRATDRILACAEVIPLTSDQLKAGMTRQLIDLGPQDALIFAAVEDFLRRHSGESSVFVNKNAKDFFTELVSQDLAKLGCKVMANFSHACSYIVDQLSKQKGGTTT